MVEGSVGRVSRIGRQRVGVRPLSKAPIRHLDPTLMLSALLLTAFGNLMVYSASFQRLEADGLPRRFLLDKQIVFSAAGVAAMILVAAFNYRRLKAWGPVAYIAGLGLLVAVLTPLGDSVRGAQRWINVGFFRLQPSEFMKLAVLAVLALLLSERKGYAEGIDAVRALALVVPVGFLVYRQPDLGTLLVLITLTITVLIVAGTRVRVLLLLVTFGIVGVVGVLHLGVLKDYQRARLTGFLDPSADPLRTGYNVTQARIAVGSGQFLGKGLFNGSQTNLAFVPEVHTDFIFTAVGEETGFLGSAALLGLYAVFLWRGIRIAVSSKDLFGTLLASGVVAIIAFQVFVNVGMTIGVSPITGIPLPFVSYGGSSMLTTFIATGILLNVQMRRVV